MGARILLIQPEWPARALLKAELEERGFDVLGADSVQFGLDLSMKRGFRPDLIVVDPVGLSTGAAETEGLSFFRGRTPLLLIRSTQVGTAEAAALSPTRELLRPIAVREIADAVVELTRPHR